MKTIIPSYYTSFKCLAGACKNSCCIGWEIDIDDKTLSEYKKLPGEFGERVRRNIDFTDETASFKLDTSERCPFLNSDGLCDIILTLGEDSICNICTDHPRFRNFFSDRTEVGLGLCCEACAEIILSCKEKVYLLGDNSPDKSSEYEEIFFSFRQKVFDLLQERNLPLDERVQNLLDICGASLPEKSLDEWFLIFSSLEQLNPVWRKLLSKLKLSDSSAANHSFNEDIDTAFEQLLVYLTFRHLWDAYDNDQIPACAAFIALSYMILRTLAALEENCTLDYLINICRIYSCEIEYSEDNMSALFDLLEE